MTSPAPTNIEDPTDRRASSRVPFAAVFRVSERDGNGRLPDPAEFRPVQALDLSHTGIAFSTTLWPTSDSLVLMMGDRDNPSLAAARIVGCRSLSTDPHEKRFEVRCEFEAWLDGGGDV